MPHIVFNVARSERYKNFKLVLQAGLAWTFYLNLCVYNEISEDESSMNLSEEWILVKIFKK